MVKSDIWKFFVTLLLVGAEASAIKVGDRVAYLASDCGAAKGISARIVEISPEEPCEVSVVLENGAKIMAAEHQLISYCPDNLVSSYPGYNAKDVERFADYEKVKRKLEHLDEQQIAELLESARSIGTGIGGVVSSLDVDGTTVFVKRISLTDRERRLENWGSTENIFDLPLYYQYGVGSTGFGVWRELEMHKMTTRWVRRGSCANFPLMYHWRVLNREKATIDSVSKHQSLDQYTAYWNNSPKVRSRIEELADSTADVVLFLEFIPKTLTTWFHEQVAQGTEAIRQVVAIAERDFLITTKAMGTNGMIHFDAHPANILTDGARLYFSDFGLAMSLDFDLSPEEKVFFAEHRHFDKYYVFMCIAGALPYALIGGDEQRMKGIMMEYALDRIYTALPAPFGAILSRYAMVSVIMAEFMSMLVEDKMTAYPEADLRKAGLTARLIAAGEDERIRMEGQYLATYKALHLGTSDTLESKTLKAFVAQAQQAQNDTGTAECG